MIILAAGTSVLRWLSDSVEARGLGDGISLLIALNIVSSESCKAQACLMPAYSTGACIGHSDPAENFVVQTRMGTTCVLRRVCLRGLYTLSVSSVGHSVS